MSSIFAEFCGDITCRCEAAGGVARYAQQSVSDAYWKAKNSGDMKSISRYANTSESEFFAECFAARELGENLPDYVNNMLDKVIKCAIKKL